MPGSLAFRLLWTSTTVSQLGTQVSELAIPFIAITTLRATPFQIGLLMAIEFLPIAIFSLPVGAVVDRLRRRPLLISADIGRAAILLSLPVAFALGRLTLIQLYVAGFCVGSLSVLFDTAYQAYLPAVVDRPQLVKANSWLQVSEQGASVIGPLLGGALISLLTATRAVLFDALSYVLSAGLIGSIRNSEPQPDRDHSSGSSSMLSEITEGFTYVLHHPILRALTLTSSILQFFGRMSMAVLLVYLVREIGLSAAAVGTVLSFGSVGFVLGALLAPMISSWLGLGRTLTVAATFASIGILLFPLGSRPVAAVFVAAGFFVYGLAALTWTVNSLSLRQTVAPAGKLGRVSATMRLLSWGSIPLGTTIGGFLGGSVGLRPTLVIGGLGALMASLPVYFSPVRQLSRLEDKT